MADAAPAAAPAGGTTTVVPDQTSTGGPSGVQGGGTAGGQQGPVVVPPNSTPSWVDSLPEAQKQYVTQKGFKDPSAVLDSYQNIEKLMGAPRERLMTLPEKMDDAKAMGEIFDRLGRPSTADGYKFEVPQGQTANTEFTKWAQGTFHQLGLTKAQGEALAKGFNEYSVNEQTAAENARIESVKQEQTALQKEWGKAYEQQLGNTRKTCTAFGLKEQDVHQLEKAFGYSKTLKFLASIGSKLGEDSFEVGNGGNNSLNAAMTPDAAQAKIKSLTEDKEWSARYLNGGAKEKEEMARLMSFAYPDIDPTVGG